jgi:Tfp pilus assembly protein PilN
MSELEEVRQTLKQVAGLVSEMVEPVKAALFEIEKARKRQLWMMVLLVFMIVMNMLVLGYVLAENRKLVAALGGVHLEQKVTAAQLEKLIDVAAQRASAPEVKQELEQIQALKKRPPQEVLQQIRLDAAASD